MIIDFVVFVYLGEMLFFVNFELCDMNCVEVFKGF